MKFPCGDLNSGPYPLHLTSICTCGVTTTPRVHGVLINFLKLNKYMYFHTSVSRTYISNN